MVSQGCLEHRHPQVSKGAGLGELWALYVWDPELGAVTGGRV